MGVDGTSTFNGKGRFRWETSTTGPDGEKLRDGRGEWGGHCPQGVFVFIMRIRPHQAHGAKIHHQSVVRLNHDGINELFSVTMLPNKHQNSWANPIITEIIHAREAQSVWT